MARRNDVAEAGLRTCPDALGATAAGCPLCYEAALPMMIECVRLDMADRAVLAGTNQFRIVAVIKGEDDRRARRVARRASDAGP